MNGEWDYQPERKPCGDYIILCFPFSVEFTDVPQDVVVVAGGQAQFTCNVEAEDPESLDISWLYDDNPIMPSPPRVQVSTDTVLINPVQSTDAGTYTCRVEDGNSGEVFVRSATLTIAGNEKR